MTADAIPLAKRISGDLDALGARWRRRFFGSPLRLGAAGGEALLSMGRPLALRLLEALEMVADSPAEGAARAPAVALAPGAAAAREVEKTVAFAGAQAVAVGARAYDVAALIFTLRDAIFEEASPEEREALAPFFEWLAVAGLEAYANATEASATERAHSEMERGTPVAVLPGSVPAAFPFGDPPASVVESVFGRLVLLAARVGARALLIDGAGLADPGGPALRDALTGLFEHGELWQRAALFVSGVEGEAAEAWRAIARPPGVRLEIARTFQEAAEAAITASGYELTPSSRAP